jgi:hypothetical protein
MDEGTYNECYLYDVSRPVAEEQPAPYTFAEGGWIVGDRICPDGIELFDSLYFTGNKTYIYHVKEGFGQKTRDACSQLLNSSRMIFDARSPSGKRTVLDRFYEKATKDKKRDNILNIDKKSADSS